MRDLAAQVTSSLLRFPEVTIEALGEDEIKLDSILHGRFAAGRNGVAWLACGPQLEVVSSTTGERLSAYRFSSIGENTPNVLTAKEFCWLKRTGLLVGLEDAAGSMLCLYDLGISRVVKAVVVPGRITAIEPLISYGGASTSTQHLHQSLRWFFGVAAVVTDVGHVLLIDLCLDDLSCSQSELEASDLEVIHKSPSEIPRIRERVTNQGRHLCLQLLSPTGTSATALQYITRTNQLAVGFSDGYLQLWNMKTLKNEYHSQLEGGRVPVYTFTFQEPENDPRNCCYLWAVQSAQDGEGDVVSLHLLQLAFRERKCSASGKILYEGLEYCEERYSQDLVDGTFALRSQATNTRLLGCQTIEKFRNHPDRDDSMNEVASPDTSVSIFSWHVKSYGQARPCTYIGVFDINRWYHAQMPDSLRTGEFLHCCSYFALWSLESVVEMTSPSPLLDVLVHERSLSRGLPPRCPPPEQFFNPTTYNFDATCLLNSGVVHLTCLGYQKETLSFLKKSGPSLNEVIPDGYNRCLMSGLLSPRLHEVQPSSLSQEEQLEAILSTAVDTSSLGLITGCIKQWTAEEQPGSAANLRFVLEWAWNKVTFMKEELDRICAPLFDSSCNFIDPQTLQALQHCQLLISNLSTIFSCFLNEAQDITEKGLVGLTNKCVVTNLISQYAQVVLWFCRSGLLPEGSDDVLQLSRPFYSYPVIKNYYTSRREKLERLSKGKWCSDCLMIDGMVSQFGDRIANLWKRDEGGTGQYPPPTLHALLDIYLLDGVEEAAKHAIVIYLLLDVMYSFPNKTESSVESFPTAFAIPVGLVKLVQGFWLLDHNDHETSLDLLLHPAACRAILSWQHARIIQALMCQGERRQALRYLQMMKPAISSTAEIMLYLTVLLHNRCMVEAWSLLRQHSNKQNLDELLKYMYEMCQELGQMEELLKLPLSLAEQECLEKFFQTTSGLQNQEYLMVHYLQQANYVPALQLNQTLKMNLVNDRDPKLKERANARNSILDQYGKVLPRIQRKLATERAKPYHHPSTLLREVARPEPLSTVAKPATKGNVLTRAAFISNVLSKISEVWVQEQTKSNPSPLKSPKVPDLPPFTPRRLSLELPEAFIGTPITKSSKRISRILDLVVQPTSEVSPEPLRFQQTPPKPHHSWSTSSPLKPSAGKPSYFENVPIASELCLLQTPQVVKRGRALASASSGFPGFTPQSILRTSQRPTPVGSPSASPGRSLTPPLRAKESRITFIEETTATSARWSNEERSEVAEDREVNLLPATSVLNTQSDSASSASVEECEFKPSEQQTPEPPADVEVEEEGVSPETSGVEGLEKMSEPHEMSHASVRSGDTTLEFHDAPTPEDLEDNVVVVNLKPADPEDKESTANEMDEDVNPEERPQDSPACKEQVQPPVFDDVDQTSSENIPTTLTRSSIREASQTGYRLSFSESASFGHERKQELFPIFSETFLVSEPAIADPVVSVHHSEECSTAASETKLEVVLEAGQESKVEIIEDLNDSVQEEPPEICYMQESSVADLPVITQEIQVKELVDEDMEAKALDEEPDAVTYTELLPSASVLIPLEFNEEQQLDREALQLEEAGAYNTAVDHEEAPATPSNFTLMLEDEDDGLAESDEHVLILELPEVSERKVQVAESKLASSEEQVDNQEADSLEDINKDVTEVHTAAPQTLSYVPEPIKMAIAENLLEAIKDTRTKEFSAEVIETSMPQEVLVTSRKLRSSSSVGKPVQLVTPVLGEVKTPSTEDRKSRRTRGKSLLVDDEQSSSVQPAAVKEVVKGHPGSSTPQKSTRSKKGVLSEDSEKNTHSEEEKLLDQTDIPDLQMPVTPRRSTRSTKHLHDSEIPLTPRRSRRIIKDTQSDGVPNNSKPQTPQKTVQTRGDRRIRYSVVEASEDIEAQEEIIDQEVPMPVTPTRSSRRTRNNVADVPENTPVVTDEKSTDQSKTIPSSPSRVTRKSLGLTLQIPQMARQEEKDTELAEQVPSIPKKRGRKPKGSTLEKPKPVSNELPDTLRRSERNRFTRLMDISEKTLLSEDLPPHEPRLQSADSLKERIEQETKMSENLIFEGEVPINDKSNKALVSHKRGSRAVTKVAIDHVPSSSEAGFMGNIAAAEANDEPQIETHDIEAPEGCADRSSETALQKLSRQNRSGQVPNPETFVFSPPRARSKKLKDKSEPLEAPTDVEPQFVFSQPVTRTRQKMGATESQTVENVLEMVEDLPKALEEKDSDVSKPRKKRETKAKKKVAWSPPPVEVNLISPMPTPDELPQGRQKKSEEGDTPVQRTGLRRNRKRLRDAIFPKPVTRRKML
uniref:AT-hook containing transcription factor 1 n=1 Tax=Lepisosteus oculatus TaxID=7918 RepID=W5NIT8_LEPOC|nr:PREDICTED: protein ELYS [Lepisosteus oculatus]XP_015206998.1 PREDICTED: protein ELYS [Lepisosteus oculatus]